ncbi:MAG: FxsA family protein [Rhizobiales bacterium]|nr:FxsA family protein [Hyphomicrobiales bacterium]OJY41053.1 MAG: hypothetical protein BGP08_04370 [Rhizobiales bacterium 64-17]
MPTPSRPSPLRWLLLAILALPLAEFAAFIAVALAIGVVQAALALIALSLLGVVLWQRAREQAAGQVRLRLDQSTIQAINLDNVGIARFAAAILLMVPGFITAFAGLLVLVPAVRRTAAGWLRRLSGVPAPPADPDVVDLAPDDWRQVPDPQLKDQRAGSRGPRPD